MRTLNDFELATVAGGMTASTSDFDGGSYGSNGQNQASLTCDTVGVVTGVAVGAATKSTLAGGLAGLLALHICNGIVDPALNPNGTAYAQASGGAGASSGSGFADGNWGCN